MEPDDKTSWETKVESVQFRAELVFEIDKVKQEIKDNLVKVSDKSSSQG